MRVAALSLRELKTELTENYVTGLTELLEELQVELAVLPSYTAFLLWIGAGYLRRPCGFLQGLQLFMQEACEWNQHFLGLHSDLARENGLYLVAGTTVEEELIEEEPLPSLFTKDEHQQHAKVSHFFAS